MGKVLTKIFVSVFMVFGYQTSNAQQVMQDSISTTTIITASSLPINNIVVTSNGNLKITSMTCITIESPFEVMYNGVLTLEIQEPDSIVFIYDNSGNRTVRKFNE